MQLAAPGTKLEVVLRDSQATEIDKRTIELGRLEQRRVDVPHPGGRAAGDVQRHGHDAPISEARSTGDFLVAAYRRPDFRVDTTLDSDDDRRRHEARRHDQRALSLRRGHVGPGRWRGRTRSSRLFDGAGEDRRSLAVGALRVPRPRLGGARSEPTPSRSRRHDARRERGAASDARDRRRVRACPYEYSLEGPASPTSPARRSPAAMHSASIRRPGTSASAVLPLFRRRERRRRHRSRGRRSRRPGGSRRGGHGRAQAPAVDERPAGRGRRVLRLGERAEGDRRRRMDGDHHRPSRCRCTSPSPRVGEYLLIATAKDADGPLDDDPHLVLRGRRGLHGLGALRSQPHRPRTGEDRPIVRARRRGS